MKLPRELRDEAAVTAARMYYQSGHSTEEIAAHLGVSRSTISRLLTHARSSGIVEIRVHAGSSRGSRMQQELAARFPRVAFHIVEVRHSFTRARVTDAVHRYAAHLVAEAVRPGMTVGLAWGNTINGIIDHLSPHPVTDVSVVQLNGAGDGTELGLNYATDIVARFAERFSASYALFPVPAFFDRAETKTALWQERSIRRILAVQRRADLLLFSTGALVGDTISHVYSAGYLTDEEVEDLRAQGVIGDIATVFYKESGASNLEINRRATGPPLSLYQRADRAICVVSGDGKVPGVLAALRAGFMTDLILDEITAGELHRLSGLPRDTTPQPTSRPTVPDPGPMSRLETTP